MRQSFPSTAVVPANLLRLHLVFSAPMATRDLSGLVHLLDSAGTDRTDLLLPLDADSWNADRTRCTFIVDPAKPGSLIDGELYTLAVEERWLDAHGLPLKQPYRRVMTIGPPDQLAIDPKAWRVELPEAGSTRPLVIIFPEALDYESMIDAFSIIGPDRKLVAGQAAIGAGESVWTFVPDEAWPAGAYSIAIATALSDPSGNTVGETFEPEAFDRGGPPPDRRQKTTLPIMIR